MQRIAKESVFSEAEVRELATRFARFSAVGTDDGLIDRSEFMRILQLPATTPSLLVDRLFHAFDTDRDGAICLSEFVAALSALSARPAAAAAKVAFSFCVWDLDGDGYLSRADIVALLGAAQSYSTLVCASAEIEAVVDATLASCASNVAKGVSLEEYKTLCARNPTVLDALTLNLHLDKA